MRAVGVVALRWVVKKGTKRSGRADLECNVFGVSEGGVVFLDVERDVLARSACVAEVSREEDPDFTFTGTGARCVLFIVEPQVVRRNWERSWVEREVVWGCLPRGKSSEFSGCHVL